MLSPEQLHGHENVPEDAYARLNKLCDALLAAVGHNSRLSLRMVQEIHALAQQMTERRAEVQRASATALPAPSRAEEAAADAGPAPFRLRLAPRDRGRSPFAAILDELDSVRDSVRSAHMAISVRQAAPPGGGAGAEPPAAGDAHPPSHERENPLKSAVAKQSDVLERLVAGYRDVQRDLATMAADLATRDAPGFSAALESFRNRIERHEQHLLALALAVKRLATAISEPQR